MHIFIAATTGKHLLTVGAAAPNTHATIPMTTSDGSLYEMGGDSYQGGGSGGVNKRYSHNSEGNRDRTSSNDSFGDSVSG